MIISPLYPEISYGDILHFCSKRIFTQKSNSVTFVPHGEVNLTTYTLWVGPLGGFFHGLPS